MNVRALAVGLGIVRLLSGCSSLAAAGPEKPNVVFVLADDLGWTDPACFGSDLHETPHIDRLAKQGMRFTQAYSACTVCSPTRASILTGKYPARLHITDWIPGQMPANPKLLVPDWTKYLPLAEPTLADAFKQAGYATACIGKWHLGGEATSPAKHGFDVTVAGTTTGGPPNGYFAPWKIPGLPEGKDGEYLTDRLGDEAVKFIERSKDKSFFLYLPHHGVHTPIQAPAALVKKYEAKPRGSLRHKNAVYAAMLDSVDDTVGRIAAKLAELKLTEKTIVVFTSDNGGRVPTTSNVPLRVGKGSAYEGGVRVPSIVVWPGVVKPGSQCDVPIMSIDHSPTLLEAAAVPDVAGHRPDGVSLVPLLKETGVPAREALYWHYPHHQHYQLGGSMPYGAIRAGDYRLIEFFDDERIELYNVKEDIGEKKDLAMQLPAKAKELHERLLAWRKEVGAQMPTANPTYDPSKPQNIPPPVKPTKN